MAAHVAGQGAHTRPDPLRLATNVGLWLLIAVMAYFLWPSILGGSTSFVLVSGNSMLPTYEDGDLVVARKAEPHIGDVIIYSPESLDGAQVIHRVVDGSAADGWIVQGDNNEWLDQWRPSNDEVVGVVKMHIPGAGIFGQILSSPWTWAFVLLAAVGLILWPEERCPEDEDDDNLYSGKSTVSAGNR